MTGKTGQYSQNWTGRAKIVSGPHAVDAAKVDAAYAKASTLAQCADIVRWHMPQMPRI